MGRKPKKPSKALAATQQIVAEGQAIATLSNEERTILKRTILAEAVKQGATDADVDLFVRQCFMADMHPLSGLATLAMMRGKPTFVIFTQGRVARAEKAGDLMDLTAAVVYDEDDFAWNAVERKPHRHISKGEGIPVGAWAMVQRRGREATGLYLPITEMNEQIVQGWSRNGQKPGWMLRTAVLRRLLRETHSIATIAEQAPEDIEIIKDAEVDEEITNGLGGGKTVISLPPEEGQTQQKEESQERPVEKKDEQTPETTKPKGIPPGEGATPAPKASEKAPSPSSSPKKKEDKVPTASELAKKIGPLVKKAKPGATADDIIAAFYTFTGKKPIEGKKPTDLLSDAEKIILYNRWDQGDTMHYDAETNTWSIKGKEEEVEL